MLPTAGNFHRGNQCFGANSLTRLQIKKFKKHNKRFFSFLRFFLEGIQVVEVLVCHWGEDLTGNGLVKRLSLSTVKESRVIPMEIIMRK